MVHSMILFILVLIFSWLLLKYLIPHYRRLHFQLGFFSLHHFCYSFYDYWTLDIDTIQILFSQKQAQHSQWITLHVRGLSLTFHSLSPNSTPLKNIVSTRSTVWLTTLWNYIRNASIWSSLAIQPVKKLSSLPIQWCLALLTRYVKLYMEGVSLKLVAPNGIYYWLCIDALNCQSTLSFIVDDSGYKTKGGDDKDGDNKPPLTETPSSLPSSTAKQLPYSLKQTQHVFRDKQINVSLVLENLHCFLGVSATDVGDRDIQDGDWQPVLQADSFPLNTALTLTPDCMTLLGANIYCGMDLLQIFILPLFRNLSNKKDAKTYSTSSSSYQTNPLSKKDTEDQHKITKFEFLQGALEIGKLIIRCDTPEKASFYSQWMLNDITFTAQSVSLQETRSRDMDITVDTITYSLVDASLPLYDYNTLNLLCTAELSVQGNLRSTGDDDLNFYDGNTSQLTVTLNSPMLAVDMVKRNLLESWISQIDRFYLLIGDDSSATTDHGFVIDRLPSVDMSLVLISPKVHFQQLLSQDHQLSLDFQGLFQCSSVRWLLSGEYDSSALSPSPSSPPTSRRKRSTNLIQRLTIPTSSSRTSAVKNGTTSRNTHVHKMVFWLTIDNMRVDYWQHYKWVPWVASNYLDLAIKAHIALPSIMSSSNNFNINTDRGHLENIIDLELQTTMETPVIHLCDNSLDMDPVVYWMVLLQPMGHILRTQSTIFSSTTTSTKDHPSTPPPLNSPIWLHLYSRCTANLSMLQAKIIMIGIDKKAPSDRYTPPGYIDNSPLQDIVTRIQFSMEKLTVDLENRTTTQISNSTNTAQALGNMHVSLQQLALTQKTTTLENRYKDDGFDQGNGDGAMMMAWISRLHVIVGLSYLRNENRSILLGVDLKLRKIGLQYSLGNHYACLLVVNALRRMNTSWQEKCGLDDMCTTTSTIRQPWPLIDKIQCQIFRFDIHIFLPGQNELFLRADDLVLFRRMSLSSKTSAADENSPLCSVTNVTLLGISPDVGFGDGSGTGNENKKWEALVELDDVEWLMDDISSAKHDVVEKAATLVMSKLFVRVPYGYVLAHVLENVVHLIKGIREMHGRVLKDSHGSPYFTYVGPIARNSPILLPTLTIQCNQVILRLDDDPFESKLRSIFYLGQSEQAKRLNLEVEFEKEKTRYTEEHHQLQQQSLKPLSSSSANSNTNKSQQRPYFTPTEYVTNENDTKTQINTAQRRLWEIYSESWIKNIQVRQQKEKTANNRIRQADYRYRCVVESLDDAYDDSDTGVGADGSDDIADLFRLDIIPLPLYSPLAQLTMTKSIVTISQQQDTHPNEHCLFPLNETMLFVQDIGKGVPLQSDFSFLIPFHLHWQAGETSVQIRDYPLPLLHVPAAVSHDGDGRQQQQWQKYPFTTPAAWSLSGNYVIADDLGVKEGSRIITIDVAQNRHQHYSLSTKHYYGIDVVRTASPTKFYSNVHYNIHTSAMSTICWSVSYQPAIQDILEILESITPAPVDPSDKIGVWDKIRLMIHTKTRIDFSVGGGDFAFVAKGTRDPYELMGLGAGMAKLWRGQVVWLLGYPNPQQEFTQIFSDSYVLGVPDLVRGGYQLSSSVSSPTSAQSKNLFLKIAIKLAGGVQMGIGCHLERTCTPDCPTCQNGSPTGCRQQCRFLYFKPHYQVVFKSKSYVGNTYHDAYAGFRSDFVHLSISIIKSLRSTTHTNDSTANNGLNAMHLTPHFVNHFRRWYGLFGGPLSLPIRHGLLFHQLKGLRSSPAPPVKFGRHIQSLKYKIMIQPMAFGYFCILDERRDGDNDGGGVDAIGLKVNVSHFGVDVHQRRKQQMTTLDYSQSASSSPGTSTGIDRAEDELYRVKSNWPLHEVEIQLRDVDLRAVYTKNTTFSPNHPSQNGININDNFGVCGSYSHQQWIDADDFRELGLDVECSVIAASGKALPFAYSPCVDYVKRLDPNWVNRNHHLKTTHSCIMGTAKGTLDTQLDYLHRRIKTVEEQLRLHQQQLDKVEMRLSKQSYNMNLLQEANDIISIIAKLNTRQHLLSKYIQQIQHLSANDPISESSPSSKHQSSDSRPTYIDDNSLKHWEKMMGRFKERYTVHNPQIIWTPAVHDIVSRWRDARAHYNIQAYNISSRATQILRDLVELGTQQEKPYKQQHGRQHRSASRSSTRNGNQSDAINQDAQDALDSLAAQNLLKKLMDDRDLNFVVDNETTQHRNQSTALDDKSDDEQDSNNTGGDKNMGDSDNNPRFQLDQIPDGCSSENMTLIDLWNPQLFLQSNTSQECGVLVANERVLVKQFEIIETSNCDVDTCAVKKRTVASVEAVQLFVVKAGLMDTVDILLDSHYGVHVPFGLDTDSQQQPILSPWIPPEMFTGDFIGKYQTTRFMRFGNDSNITGTIQYDRLNPIRSSSAYLSGNHYQPWDDQCNSTHLNFPNFVFTANPYQYGVLYQVIVDIILFKKEPRHLERSDRLRDITFSIYASGDSPRKTLDDVIELQAKIRHYAHLYQEYQRKLVYNDCSSGDFDDNGLALLRQRYNSARQHLATYNESLYLLMQSFKQIMDKYHYQHGTTNTNQTFNDGPSMTTQTNSNNNQAIAVGKIKISVKSLVWKMLQDDGSPFSQWRLTNTSYVLITNKDQSLCHTLEIDKLLVKNTSSSPIFKQVVGPYLEPSVNSSSATPMALPDFSRHKMVYGRLISLKPVGGIPVIQQLEINVYPLRLQLTYDFWRAFVVYLFPASSSPPKTSASASSLNSMATASGTLSTSTRARPTHDSKATENTFSFDRDIKLQSSSSSLVSAPLINTHPLETSPNSAQQDGSSANSDNGIWFGAKRAASTPTPIAITQTTASSSLQQQKDITTTKRKSWVISSGLPKLRKSSRYSDEYPDDDDLAIMKQRASNNRTFILIKIHSAKHCLSFQGTKNIYDLQNFRFRQPHLEYRNKTWSWYDLLNALKKDFLRAVIKHSPALIKEKLKPSRLLHDTNRLGSSYSDDEELSNTANQQQKSHILPKTPTIDLADSLAPQKVIELGVDGWFNDDSSENSTDDLEVDDGGHSIRSANSSHHLYVCDKLDFSTGIISDNLDEENDLISLHSNHINKMETVTSLADLNAPINSEKQREQMDNGDGLFGKTLSRLLPFSKKGKQRKSLSLSVDAFGDYNDDGELERLQKGRLLFGKSYR